MAHPTHQQYADLAEDAYENRIPSRDEVPIGGNKYEVLAVANDRRSGYQGTVYRDIRTNAIIVAHRGTESSKDDWRDAVTDLAMVLNRKNGQAQAAVDLTRKAMEELAKFNERFPDANSKPTLTHTGHSLGGALAQICAHYFDHGGVTFNAYGAASMGRIPEGIAQGGDKVVNYVKASDPVAAASPHYGQTVVLAAKDDTVRLAAAGYSNSTLANTAALLSPALAVSRTATAAAFSVGSAHGIDNFTGSTSILSDPHARKHAQENKVMIDAYRSNVNTARQALGLPMLSLDDIYKHFTPRPAGEPAAKDLPPLSQASDIVPDIPGIANQGFENKTAQTQQLQPDNHQSPDWDNMSDQDLYAAILSCKDSASLGALCDSFTASAQGQQIKAEGEALYMQQQLQQQQLLQQEQAAQQQQAAPVMRI